MIGHQNYQIKTLMKQKSGKTSVRVEQSSKTGNLCFLKKRQIRINISQKTI